MQFLPPSEQVNGTEGPLPKMSTEEAPNAALPLPHIHTNAPREVFFSVPFLHLGKWGVGVALWRLPESPRPPQ